MRKLSFILLILLLTAASPARSAEAFDASACAATVAPYVDENTLIVVRIDLAHVDVQAMWDRIDRMFRETQDGDVKEIAEFTLREPLSRWVEQFRQAGGSEVYFLVNPVDWPRPPFGIAPLRQGDDAEAMAGLLFGGPLHGKPDGPTSRPAGRSWPTIATRLDDVVFVGSHAQLERVQALTPAARPELARALAAVGGGAAQAVLLLSEDTRLIIEEMLPVIPDELGGGPSSVITRGLRWGALSISTPPKMSLDIVADAADAESAQALARLAAQNLEALEYAGRMARRARQVRDIAMAMHIYVNEHDGQWPENLEALVEEGYLKDKSALVCPLHPEREVGYVYLKPAEKEPSPQRMVIYEAHEAWPLEGVAVGYVDTHVEMIKGQSHFEEFLRKAGGQAEAGP